MTSSYVLVAVGGAIGACARLSVNLAAQRVIGIGFPWGTFVVNVVGCFLFGVVAGLADTRGALGPAWRMFLLVGVLGGFTTYSSFAFETVELLRTGQTSATLFHVVGQLVLCTFAVVAGLVITR